MNLPHHIVQRLVKAGKAANAIRTGNVVEGQRARTYSGWIEEIDQATAEARRLRPDLFRQGVK